MLAFLTGSLFPSSAWEHISSKLCFAAWRETLILDGTALAREILNQCSVEVRRLQRQHGMTPCLAVVQIGEDARSLGYIRLKQRRCESIGMRLKSILLPGTVTTQKLVAVIDTLNNDPEVNGILLQRPVPERIDENVACDAISSFKDVDGVTTANVGATWLDRERFTACTPAGIMTLLRAHHVALEGRNAIVIGRSLAFGMPMAALLLNAHCTVTMCHRHTTDLPTLVQRADIVITGTGHPKFVKGGWIKSGAVVVDAGYVSASIGDVDFEAAIDRASLISPVPGGVGPMTVAVLIEQTLKAARIQMG